MIAENKQLSQKTQEIELVAKRQLLYKEILLQDYFLVKKV
jgi:hypothetical protein